MLAPKAGSVLPSVIGMMLDFSVFELSDAIDFLLHPDEFKTRLEEGLSLKDDTSEIYEDFSLTKLVRVPFVE